jgi:hypothetical protein
MILAEIKFQKKETILGKQLTFNATITEIETKNGRYRHIVSDYEPDYELLYNYRHKTLIGLNECASILRKLGYGLTEVNI